MSGVLIVESIIHLNANLWSNFSYYHSVLTPLKLEDIKKKENNLKATFQKKKKSGRKELWLME